MGALQQNNSLRVRCLLFTAALCYVSKLFIATVINNYESSAWEAFDMYTQYASLYKLTPHLNEI